MGRFSLLATALLIGAVAGSPAAANIVTNGSFEQGSFVGGSFGFPNAQQVNSGDSTTLPGWTVSNAELAWDRNGQAGIISQDGLYNLDLTGFNDSAGTYGAVSQTLSTIVGATYRLVFYGGNYTPQGAVAAGITASAGAMSQTFLIPPVGTPTPGSNSFWTAFGFDFTATGTSTLLTLGGANFANSDPTFIGLDNVSVELLQAPPGGVPEPATWLTMIVGFGAIGGALRRRPARVARLQTVTA